MRRAAAAAALLLCMGAPAAAQEATGRWRTPEDGGLVELYRCGAALCGKVLAGGPIARDAGVRDARNRDPALRGRPVKGLEFLTGFTGGPPEWRGGKVYNPKDGRTYRGTITLTGADTLKLTGCVVPPLCRTQVWRRAD